MANDKSLSLSKSFEKNPESNNDQIFPNREVSVEDVKGFMNDCIFAVNQPNENKLGELISEKIGQDFKLISSDLASNNYLKKILDWFKEKPMLSRLENAH